MSKQHVSKPHLAKHRKCGGQIKYESGSLTKRSFGFKTFGEVSLELHIFAGKCNDCDEHSIYN